MSLRKTGHGLHLLAAHRALNRQLDEIEKTAVEGRAPGAQGKALTPLPPELWTEIGSALARIGAVSESIARRHAPESLPTEATRQPVSATLRWVSLLLRRLDETLEDLDPQAITRKFGPFPAAEEAAQMETEVAEIREQLVKAQRALDAFRTANPTEKPPA